MKNTDRSLLTSKRLARVRTTALGVVGFGALTLSLAAACGESGGVAGTGGVSARGGTTASTGGTTTSTGGTTTSTGGTTTGTGGTATGTGGTTASTGGTTASTGGSSSGGQANTGGGSTGGGTTGGGMATGGATTAGSGGSSGSTAAGGVAGGTKATGGTSSGGSDASGCPTSELVGWAAFEADGTATTKGGGNAAPVRAGSAAELASLAGDSTARVIEIASSFDVGTLTIKSNKTLVGIGPNVTLTGGLSIVGSDASSMISNVIVRNLNIKGRGTSGTPADAFAIRFAHHVWVDHCNIWDGPDGILDMTRGASYVTVSWSKFWYTDPSHTHRLACLISGGSTHGDTDTGRMNATYHHNWFAELVDQRMPRILFGKAHVFNNLYAAPGNTYCVRAAHTGAALVENNHFEGVNNPHELDESTAPAHITAKGNAYVNTTGKKDNGGGGTPFTTPPYPYKVDDVSVIPALVRKCAGPR